MDKDSVAYVSLFGIMLAGATAPEQGLYWTDLEGWWGLPDSKGSPDSIPGAHGSFIRGRHYRESRVMTLTGHILADSPTHLAEVRTRIESAWAEGSGEMYVVTDSYGSWYRTVEVDTLVVDPDHGELWTKFTVDLIAPDPLRYQDWLTEGPVGLPTRSGGLILPKAFPWNFGTEERDLATVSNWGSVPVYPIITVSGTANSVAVHGGAGRLDFGKFSGDLVFDSSKRRAFLNGSEVTRDMVRRDWPIVAPGGVSNFHFTATTPSPGITLTVEYRFGEW